MNLQQQLAQFPRLDLVGTATPLEKLSRLSDYLGQLARALAFPGDLPAGAVLALIGSPCFVWLVRRRYA